MLEHLCCPIHPRPSPSAQIFALEGQLEPSRRSECRAGDSIGVRIQKDVALFDEQEFRLAHGEATPNGGVRTFRSITRLWTPVKRA